MKNAYLTYLELPDDSSEQEWYLIHCNDAMNEDLREKLLKTPNIEDEAAMLSLYCHEHFNKFGEEFIVN